MATIGLLSLAPAQVIAAAQEIDQSAKAAASSLDADGSPGPAHGSTAGHVVILLFAAGGLALFFGRRWHRLARAPRQPAAFTPDIGLLLFVAMFALGHVGVMAAARAFGMAGEDTTSDMSIRQTVLLTLGAYAGQSLAAGAWLWGRARARVSSPDPRWRRWRAAVFGLAVTPFAFALTALVGEATARVMGSPDDPIAHETLRDLMDAPWDRWTIALAFLAVIGAPVLEEIMHRGLLQRTTIAAGLSRWTAIAVTSVLFAFAHLGAVPPHMLPALGTLSMALGWAVERTGRLTTAVVMHVAFNAANLGMAMLLA